MENISRLMAQRRNARRRKAINKIFEAVMTSLNPSRGELSASERMDLVLNIPELETQLTSILKDYEGVLEHGKSDNEVSKVI